MRLFRSRRTVRTVVVFLTLLLLAAAGAQTASALSGTDYTLVEGGRRMPIAKTYSFGPVLSAFEVNGKPDHLNAPEDLFIDENGYLYIADTGNARVVKLSSTGEFVSLFTGPEEKPLKNPTGIFADADGLYIADPGNYRILHLSKDGSFVEEFTKPVSDKLEDDFIFDPTKVLVTKTGYIYALKGQSLITIDGYNHFRGYVGQSKITYSLSETLVRLFGSEKQKLAIRTRHAASYTNITLDHEGLIYASTLDSLNGEIKRLNAVGKNIYRDYSGADAAFDDLRFRFGDVSLGPPQFVDLTVGESGIVSALDAAASKVFQYDAEGNLLAVFGSYGQYHGGFTNPVSIAGDRQNNLYVLDKGANQIRVFRPTEFIKRIHEAIGQYNLGDYEAAKNHWKHVLQVCENYQMANIGLAQASYKQGDWQEAMDQYAAASDRLGYSKAFSKYRQEFVRRHFLWVAGAAILVFTALGFAVFGLKRISEKSIGRHYSRHEKRYGIGNMLSLSVGTVFHPFDTFSILKGSRKNLKIRAGLIILFAALATRVFFIFAVHYPFVQLDPRDANLIIEFAKLILPVITYALACFMFTSIVGGESKLNEIFTACCFSLVPQIFINLFLTFISHVMSRGEQGFFIFLQQLSLILTVLLFLLFIHILNHYTLRKTLFVAVFSLLTTALVWIVIMLILALSLQLWEFIAGVILEIRMMHV